MSLHLICRYGEKHSKDMKHIQVLMNLILFYNEVISFYLVTIRPQKYCLTTSSISLSTIDSNNIRINISITNISIIRLSKFNSIFNGEIVGSFKIYFDSSISGVFFFRLQNAAVCRNSKYLENITDYK